LLLHGAKIKMTTAGRNAFFLQWELTQVNPQKAESWISGEKNMTGD
jgi:hypothetical protein